MLESMMEPSSASSTLQKMRQRQNWGRLVFLLKNAICVRDDRIVNLPQRKRTHVCIRLQRHHFRTYAGEFVSRETVRNSVMLTPKETDDNVTHLAGSM